MAGLEELILDLDEFELMFWLRFMDDFFCIWMQGEEKVKVKISYFEVLVSKSGNGRLSTNIVYQTY